MYLATANIIIVSTVMPTLATVLTTMRVLARLARKHKDPPFFLLSDYLVFVSLFCAWALCVTAICGTAINRVGTPSTELTQAELTGFLKMMFALQFFYISSVGLIKLSVLAFYRSIFTTKGFCLTCNITMGVVTAWVIAMLLGTLLRSKPISYNWAPQQPGHHGNIVVLFSFVGASDIFLDIFVVMLPMPMIRKLHMSTHRKLAVAGIFGLGGFCVISSAVRLVYIVRFVKQYEGFGDFYSNLVVENLVWKIVEPAASVIAACLPTLGPLFEGCKSPAFMFRSIRSRLSLDIYANDSPVDSWKEKGAIGSANDVSTPMAGTRHGFDHDTCVVEILTIVNPGQGAIR